MFSLTTFALQYPYQLSISIALLISYLAIPAFMVLVANRNVDDFGDNVRSALFTFFEVTSWVYIKREGPTLLLEHLGYTMILMAISLHVIAYAFIINVVLIWPLHYIVSRELKRHALYRSMIVDILKRKELTNRLMN